MKFLISVFAFLTWAIAQDSAPEMKHLMIPVLNGKATVKVSALNIDRGAEYPTIVKLTGQVEIKSPVCLPVGKKGGFVCDGYMVLHADEAQLDEASGHIEAHGNVSVAPLQHEH
jgi:hypothetical protein